MILNQDELLNSIVKGIVSGYKDYIEIRKEANKKLYISDAYAYIKSNHIDSEVASHVKSYIDFQKRSAGPAWKFLEFKEQSDYNEKRMVFILKNERYFDKNNVTFGKNALSDKEKNEKKYLADYVEKNIDVDFQAKREEYKSVYQPNADDILFKPQKNKKVNEGEEFYIVTYNIDVLSAQLNSVKLWMPNPKDNKAIILRDLTEELNDILQSDETYSIDSDDLEVLKSDMESEKTSVDAEKDFSFVLEEVEEEGLK